MEKPGNCEKRLFSTKWYKWRDVNFYRGISTVVTFLFSPPKTTDIFLNAQGTGLKGKGKGTAGRPVGMCFLNPYLTRI